MPTAAAYVASLSKFMPLGRIRPKAPPQVLRLASYLQDFRGVPPASVDFSAKALNALSRMYLNDQYGDCVIAGKYHQVGIWTGNESGAPVLGTDGEVLSSYHTICGPGDNGCNISEVLDYFRSNGLTVNGQKHKIDGYCAVDGSNELEVQTALYLFGSLTLGLNLPGSWANNAKPGFVWDVTHDRTVGGHDVCACGYNAQGVQICTWGMIGTITWAAMADKNIVEEIYTQLAPDWYAKASVSPLGIDAATLKADLAKLGGGTIPPLPDPVPPPDPPVPPAPLPFWDWLLNLLKSIEQWLVNIFSHPATAANATALALAIDWAAIFKALLSVLGKGLFAVLSTWLTGLPLPAALVSALLAILRSLLGA